MAFIVNLRTPFNAVAGATGAIPNSTLQLTDLWPNKSQRNQIYDPVGLGPHYVNRCDTGNALIATSPVVVPPTVVANATTAARASLAAYFIANVDNAAGGTNITSAQAFSSAGATVDSVFTGATRPGDTAVGSTELNAILASVAVGTVFHTTGGMTVAQHVINVLSILSGATFTLPAGTANNTGVGLGTFNTSAQNEAQFNGTRPARIADTDSSLTNSILNGQLSFLGNDTLDLFGAAAAARVVQVYGDDGSLLM